MSEYNRSEIVKGLEDLEFCLNHAATHLEEGEDPNDAVRLKEQAKWVRAAIDILEKKYELDIYSNDGKKKLHTAEISEMEYGFYLATKAFKKCLPNLPKEGEVG